jgi:hypothetical protein
MRHLLLTALGSIALTLLPPASSGAPYAIAAKQVDLKGYRLLVDSFDSADPTRSTDGRYDPLKAGDTGDVATEAGILNSLNVGDVQIWGGVLTGSPFSLALGPVSSVGSAAWHQAGQLGIEPGYHDTTFVWAFPDVALPSAGWLTPVGGTLDGVYYTYILGAGDYRLSSLSMSGSQKLLAIGAARLVVDGNLSLSGNAEIIVLPSAALRLYSQAATVNFRGNGISNLGAARNFLYLGLPGNTTVNLRIGRPFVGSIYAPSAVCNLTSAGGGVAGIEGLIISQSVELGANVRLHLDLDLGR